MTKSRSRWSVRLLESHSPREAAAPHSLRRKAIDIERRAGRAFDESPERFAISQESRTSPALSFDDRAGLSKKPASAARS